MIKYYWIEAAFGNEVRRIRFKSSSSLRGIESMIFEGITLNHNYFIFDNTSDKPKDISGINLSRADEILVYPL